MKPENQIKDLPNYIGLYAIKDNGSVLSLKRGKFLAVNVKRGYETVTLYKKGSLKTFLVHRLVAQVFIPVVMGKTDVNHKDGNKLNNEHWNLEWCNDSENQIHARKLGLQGGERSNTAKLNVQDVRQIRKLYAAEMYTMKALGKRFGVNEQTISKIINRQTWRYV